MNSIDLRLLAEEAEEETDRLRADLAAVTAERDRLLVECEAWRDGRLWLFAGYEFVYEEHGYPTITAAVDALMAEREVTP
jgi:hypothetical protein